MVRGRPSVDRALRQASADDDATDGTFELAHAGTLQFFAELVTELGGDPTALMHAAGLELTALDAYAPRLNYRAMIALLEAAATQLRLPDFGLRLAVRQGGKVFGPIGVAMRNSRTLGDALYYVADHFHAYSLAASMRVGPERASRTVLVAFDILLANVPDKTQMLEQMLLLGHRNAMEMTGGRARVREVRFRHQPVSPLRVYREYFGCEVRFDQPTDGIVFTNDDLSTELIAPRAGHYEMAAYFIATKFPSAEAPMHARVRGSIKQRLGVSTCKLEDVAEELCMHHRTLHRRLQDEGKSFDDIKEEVRRDMAQYYLEHTEVPFARIAEKLGYSEPSVLSRRCLRWFDASPSVVRSRGRGAPTQS